MKPAAALLIAVSLGFAPALAQDQAAPVTAPVTAEPVVAPADTTTASPPTFDVIPFAEALYPTRAALYLRNELALPGAVDVYIDGRLIATNLLQGSVSLFPVALPVGEYQLTLVRAGAAFPAVTPAAADVTTTSNVGNGSSPSDIATTQASADPTLAPDVVNSDVLLSTTLSVGSPGAFTLALSGNAAGLSSNLTAGSPNAPLVE